MRNCLIPALLITLSLMAACSQTPYHQRKATSPLLMPSAQVQQQFFACKDLIGNEWIGIGQNFSTDDERIIVIARLDPSELDSLMMLELVSPENRIIERESHEYSAVRDVGIYFDPVKLADKGGPGLYRANIYSDSRPMGQVEFFLEDRREEGPIIREGLNPTLSGIQWDTPSE